MQNQANVAVEKKEEVAFSSTTSKVIQLGSAFLLGAVIMYGAGFMNMPAAHNAAHDMRHSQGFPCH